MEKVYGSFAMTGNYSLSSLDGAKLNSKDSAIVFLEDSINIYTLNSNSSSSENIPTVIMPRTNPAKKRWKLISNIPNDITNLTPLTNIKNGKIFGVFELIGEESLKLYDGAILKNGDAAMVFMPPKTYIYRLYDSNNSVEDIPNVITPTTNPENKRWLLTTTLTATI